MGVKQSDIPLRIDKVSPLLVTYSILDLWFPISMPRGGGATQRRDQRRRTQRLGRWCTVAADAADAADHAGGGVLDGRKLRGFAGFSLAFQYGHMISIGFCKKIQVASEVT